MNSLVWPRRFYLVPLVFFAVNALPLIGEEDLGKGYINESRVSFKKVTKDELDVYRHGLFKLLTFFEENYASFDAESVAGTSYRDSLLDGIVELLFRYYVLRESGFFERETGVEWHLHEMSKLGVSRNQLQAAFERNEKRGVAWPPPLRNEEAYLREKEEFIDALERSPEKLDRQ